ncbi:hypothetical protein OJJOAM_001349 [Cupriavidus sp. H18C1]
MTEAELRDAGARADPDALLRMVQQEGERAARGKLRVYFGASAGVGKTFAMLTAARAAMAEGTDVAIGVVETHGRAETEALLAGLERLPMREVPYRGRVLHEFDLDGALARQPALILVDELAHSNAPGSRHPKRWQDIQELRAAGIDVWTTVNVQHLDSLNEAVGGITGIRVWETVPDAVFDGADEVVLVDLPADELLRRLKEGRVYLPEQARHAARHFFRKGNLIALRELALRRTAERVDHDVRAWRQSEPVQPVWRTREAVLACIGSGDDAEQVVRSARRLADQLDCDWHVVTVATPRLAPPSGACQGPPRGRDADGRAAGRAHRDAGRRGHGAGGGRLCAAPQPDQGGDRARAGRLAARRCVAGRTRAFAARAGPVAAGRRAGGVDRTAQLCRRAGEGLSRDRHHPCRRRYHSQPRSQPRPQPRTRRSAAAPRRRRAAGRHRHRRRGARGLPVGRGLVRRRLGAVGAGHAMVRRGQYRDAVSRRRDGRRAAARPRAGGIGLGAVGGSLRFLLRAASAVVRRHGRAVPADLRGAAVGGPGDRPADRGAARAGAGRGAARDRCAHAVRTCARTVVGADAGADRADRQSLPCARRSTPIRRSS